MKYYKPPKWFVQMCETKQLVVDEHGNLTICGSPFVGKTDAIRRLAKKHGVKVKDLKWPSPKSWADVGGLPLHMDEFNYSPDAAATAATLKLLKNNERKPVNLWNVAADMMINPALYPNGYPPKKKRRKNVK